jgi:hypothetical protein
MGGRTYRPDRRFWQVFLYFSGTSFWGGTGISFFNGFLKIMEGFWDVWEHLGLNINDF